MKYVSSIVSICISSIVIQAQTYSQYNRYTQADCAGQPIYMVSSQSGQCQIAGTPASQCSATGGPSSVYDSQKLLCSENPLNLQGIVQWYVATSQWSSNSKCEGNPFQVEAMVADALCHPAQSKDGVITSYFSVNCNGGRPLYKICKDSECADCTESQSTGDCEVVGAGASRKVQCIKPGANVGKKFFDDGEEEDSSASQFCKKAVFGSAAAAVASILSL